MQEVWIGRKNVAVRVIAIVSSPITDEAISWASHAIAWANFREGLAIKTTVGWLNDDLTEDGTRTVVSAGARALAVPDTLWQRWVETDCGIRDLVFIVRVVGGPGRKRAVHRAGMCVASDRLGQAGTLSTTIGGGNQDVAVLKLLTTAASNRTYTGILERDGLA